MCRADNSEGSNQASAEIKFTEDGEDISITSNRLMFSEGTYLDRLLCTVNTYIYEYDLAWFKDGEQVKKIGQFEGKFCRFFHSKCYRNVLSFDLNVQVSTWTHNTQDIIDMLRN